MGVRGGVGRTQTCNQAILRPYSKHGLVQHDALVREPDHLVLARPRDRRVEQAGDADPVWQSTFDGGFD